MPKRALQLSEEEERKEFARNIGRRRETRQIEGMWESAGQKRPSMEDIGSMAPTMGMTRYLTSGVPDVAGRALATSGFLEQAKKLGPDFEQAASFFAERYPRIAAHMSLRKLKSPDAGFGITSIGSRAKANPNATPVALRTTRTGGPKNIEDTLLHEGTHVAQELGSASRRGGSGRLYKKADKALRALGFSEDDIYALNPAEISARTAALRKMGTNVEPYSMLKGMRSLVERLPAGSEERLELAKLLINRGR